MHIMQVVIVLVKKINTTNPKSRLWKVIRPKFTCHKVTEKPRGKLASSHDNLSHLDIIVRNLLLISPFCLSIILGAKPRVSSNYTFNKTCSSHRFHLNVTRIIPYLPQLLVFQKKPHKCMKDIMHSKAVTITLLARS